MEVHKFEMAQHIDKQITDVSSTINVLKMVPKLGESPNEVLMQPREKIGFRHDTGSAPVNK